MSKWRGSFLFAILIVTFILYLQSPLHQQRVPQHPYTPPKRPQPVSGQQNSKFNWADVPQRFPVTSFQAVPTIAASTIPKIQHVFKKESSPEKKVRLSRLQQVKGNFTHAWNAYKEHAWLRDELKPISGGSEDSFGGWAASLVDSLGRCLPNKIKYSR